MVDGLYAGVSASDISIPVAVDLRSSVTTGIVRTFGSTRDIYNGLSF